MICGNMEINKVLEEMEFFSNIFNILEERRKTVLFRTKKKPRPDYRNSYSHYRDITVTVASLRRCYIHRENCSILLVSRTLSSLLEIPFQNQSLIFLKIKPFRIISPPPYNSNKFNHQWILFDSRVF